MERFESGSSIQEAPCSVPQDLTQFGVNSSGLILLAIWVLLKFWFRDLLRWVLVYLFVIWIWVWVEWEILKLEFGYWRIRCLLLGTEWNSVESCMSLLVMPLFTYRYKILTVWCLSMVIITIADNTYDLVRLFKIYFIPIELQFTSTENEVSLLYNSSLAKRKKRQFFFLKVNCKETPCLVSWMTVW